MFGDYEDMIAAEKAEKARFEALTPEQQKIETLEKEVRSLNSTISYQKHWLDRLSNLNKELHERLIKNEKERAKFFLDEYELSMQKLNLNLNV